MHLVLGLDGVGYATTKKLYDGGYFREFTFAKKRTVGWTDCGHNTPARGIVLDPFAGTGTTLKTAVAEGRDAIGVDLVPLMNQPEIGASEPSRRAR